MILGRNGIVNETVMALGLSATPLRLLFSETGVVIVLAQVQLPLMVLPLMTTLQRIDPNLASASAALGAGSWRTFFRVVLPLSLPGILAGTILTYSACVTAFVTQSLIGGSRLLYMPMMIFQQALDLPELAVRGGDLGDLHGLRAAGDRAVDDGVPQPRDADLWLSRCAGTLDWGALSFMAVFGALAAVTVIALLGADAGDPAAVVHTARSRCTSRPAATRCAGMRRCSTPTRSRTRHWSA